MVCDDDHDHWPIGCHPLSHGFAAAEERSFGIPLRDVHGDRPDLVIGHARARPVQGRAAVPLFPAPAWLRPAGRQAHAGPDRSPRRSPVTRACLDCGEPLRGRRDRLTCSSACRQRRVRRQRGQAPGRRRMSGHIDGSALWEPVVAVTSSGQIDRQAD